MTVEKQRNLSEWFLSRTKNEGAALGGIVQLHRPKIPRRVQLVIRRYLSVAMAVIRDIEKVKQIYYNVEALDIRLSIGAVADVCAR
jgi:hypothetical protein